MAKNNGLGGPSMGLLTPSVPPEPPVVTDAEPPVDAEPEADGEGRGEASEARSRAGRARRRPAPAAKGKSRNLHLSEDIYFRLSMVALQRGLTLSDVASDVLNRGLPRFEVKRQG